MQSFGRAGPGNRPTGEKSAVQIGTELLQHGASHAVGSLLAWTTGHYPRLSILHPQLPPLLPLYAFALPPSEDLPCSFLLLQQTSPRPPS
jgi:hypothetical protein